MSYWLIVKTKLFQGKTLDKIPAGEIDTVNHLKL